MPEALECEAAGQQAEKSFNAAQDTGHQFVLQKIAVDATKAEAARRDASQEAKEGLVYDLDATSTVKRGQNYHQTDVYPPTLRATADNPYPSPLSTLVLEKITYTNRAMILHFGTLFFMVGFYLHVFILLVHTMLPFQASVLDPYVGSVLFAYSVGTVNPECQ